MIDLARDQFEVRLRAGRRLLRVGPPQALAPIYRIHIAARPLAYFAILLHSHLCAPIVLRL